MKMDQDDETYEELAARYAFIKAEIERNQIRMANTTAYTRRHRLALYGGSLTFALLTVESKMRKRRGSNHDSTPPP